MPKITFLPDNKRCESPNNVTLLEVAKRNNIPHVAACGGEGKCTTCRLLILEGIEHCSEETDKEKELIEKAHTTKGFRLACQTSISGDITARRLVLDSDDIKDMSFDRQGKSKKIAILFSDIRGFTPFSEKLTPYDVVFILNRYFKRMVQVVENNNGRVDNYIGDGMVAIFGIENQKDPAEYAVKSALEMCEEMDDMRPYLKTMYGKDFDIGVGVHWGNAVVGDIGAGESKRLTAIGDAMNFASRVESANKQFKSRVLISDDVFKEIKESLVIKDFMRTTIKGIEGRVTLHEVDQIHLTGEREKIKQNHNCSILFYGKQEKIQLRLKTKCKIHFNDEVTKESWEKTGHISRKCYLVTNGPGTESETPTSGLDNKFDNFDFTKEESESGYKNFCVIKCKSLDEICKSLCKGLIFLMELHLKWSVLLYLFSKYYGQVYATQHMYRYL